MSGMRRGDRRTNSDDNAVRNPRSRQQEPPSPHDIKIRIATLQAQRDEAQQIAKAKEKEAQEAQRLYLEEQQQRQSTLALYQEEQQRYQSTLTLYQEEQQRYQSTLVLYEEAQTQVQTYLTFYEQEKVRNNELLAQYETARTERDRYLMLYNETQAELKLERRSKAGIKGWETRRKRENERLKREIADMAIVLRDSLERKEAAIAHLEELANRMDRIQNLVDSVEDNSDNNPIGLLQKFKLIWQAVKDILAE
jgi:Flp pilus assembly secretin CpaC